MSSAHVFMNLSLLLLWGTCFTGGYILQDDLFYRWIPYMRTSLTGRYVL